MVTVEEYVDETVLPVVDESTLLTEKPRFENSETDHFGIALPQDMELADCRVEVLAQIGGSLTEFYGNKIMTSNRACILCSSNLMIK